MSRWWGEIVAINKKCTKITFYLIFYSSHCRARAHTHTSLYCRSFLLLYFPPPFVFRIELFTRIRIYGMYSIRTLNGVQREECAKDNKRIALLTSLCAFSWPFFCTMSVNIHGISKLIYGISMCSYGKIHLKSKMITSSQSFSETNKNVIRIKFLRNYRKKLFLSKIDSLIEKFSSLKNQFFFRFTDQ